MVSVCKLGGFAYTPRLLAGGLAASILKERTLTDLEVVESIERDTGYNFGIIHGEVQNIRDIRRYTSDVPKYLRSRKSKEIYEYYTQLPTVDKAMEMFDPQVYRLFPEGETVAVIGLELFDDLDKHMLPLDFTEIDPFTDGEYHIEKIHAIGNDRQIASGIVDLIDADRSNDTAVVLDAGGSIADAVRSAMYKKKIPFRNSLDVKDLAQVRDYLQFVSLGLSYSTLRVADVRELFSVYQTGFNKNKGKELRPELDRYLLSRVPLGDNVEPVTERLMETMRDMEKITFAEAAERLFDRMPQKTSVLILLDTMHLTDEKVDGAKVAKLSYAVNHIADLKHNEQVPENERKGVLIADCRNSVYVDRPFVIFIGLDEAWEPSAAGKDYVDKQRLSEDNAYRMEILLQQGTSRIYAVKPVTGGKETAPSPTFQTMSDLSGGTKGIESFNDICREYIRGSWTRAADAAPTESGEMSAVSEENDWKFSKSTYNAYSDCPVKFMFTKLIRTEDNEYTVFGSCIHEFAEFYFCYPEIVKEKGVEYYLSRLDSMYAGMSSECQRGLDVSRFRVYLNNLVRYIDSVRPKDVPLDSLLSSRKYPNAFMLEEKLERCSSMTESELQSLYPVFAKYDACFGNTLIDYKTGRAKEAEDIIKGFTRRGKQLSEFQALIYLQVLEDNVGHYPCEFRLFFLGDNDIASVDPTFDVGRNQRTVILCEGDLGEVAFGPNGVLKDMISDLKTYREYSARWNEVGPILNDMVAYGPPSDDDAEELLNRLGMKQTATNLKSAAGLLGKAYKLVEKKFMTDTKGRVVVPHDTMHGFLEQLTKDRVSAGKEMTLPVYGLEKGNINCRSCGYYKVCMKAEEDDDE